VKQKFEHRLLKGALNIKCKNDDGSFRMWNTRKETVVQNIIDTVNEFQALGYRLTLRQLHYQLVSKNQIVNHQTAYKKLGVILDDCRYSGVIDWNMIEDRGRQRKYPYYEDSVAGALKKTADCYRLERQQGQTNHVEVWTEKDALSEIFWRSVHKYGIGLCVNKGYTSSSAIYSSYTRFSKMLEEGGSVTILYFGDHDPSGLDMIRDIDDRLRFMFDNGEWPIDAEYNFNVIPIGLTMKQIKRYKLPPNPAKITDTRAAAYIKKFGQFSWEVDALRPEVLTEIVEANINEQISIPLMNEVMELEKTHIKRLEKIIKNEKNL
jgi:hypothetical protein